MHTKVATCSFFFFFLLFFQTWWFFCSNHNAGAKGSSLNRQTPNSPSSVPLYRLSHGSFARPTRQRTSVPSLPWNSFAWLTLWRHSCHLLTPTPAYFTQCWMAMTSSQRCWRCWVTLCWVDPWRGRWSCSFRMRLTSKRHSRLLIVQQCWQAAGRDHMLDVAVSRMYSLVVRVDLSGVFTGWMCLLMCTLVWMCFTHLISSFDGCVYLSVHL